MRPVQTSVNRQPAIAFYLWDEREDAYLSLTLDVLRISDGAITEVITFHNDQSRGSGCRSVSRSIEFDQFPTRVARRDLSLLAGGLGRSQGAMAISCAFRGPEKITANRPDLLVSSSIHSIEEI